jgi:hypothetical protein
MNAPLVCAWCVVCVCELRYQVLGADVAWAPLLTIQDDVELYDFEQQLGSLLTLAATSFVELPEWSRLLTAAQVLTAPGVRMVWVYGEGGSLSPPLLARTPSW